MNRPARRRSSYKNIEDQQQSQTDAIPSSSATNNSSDNKNNGNGNGNGNAMDGAHRKIELQSPEDLTFLINNVRRAAEEHINAAFPPVDDGQDDAAAGGDELRVRIEKLVADVCFSSLNPSLSFLYQIHQKRNRDTDHPAQQRAAINSISPRPSPSRRRISP